MKKENAFDLVEDSEEMIERCLNCKLPQEVCLGEYKCKAIHRAEVLRKEEVVRYATNKGIGATEIEKQTDGEISRHFADIYKSKMRGKRTIGHDWSHATGSNAMN